MLSKREPNSGDVGKNKKTAAGCLVFAGVVATSFHELLGATLAQKSASFVVFGVCEMDVIFSAHLFVVKSFIKVLAIF